MGAPTWLLWAVSCGALLGCGIPSADTRQYKVPQPTPTPTASTARPPDVTSPRPQDTALAPNTGVPSAQAPAARRVPSPPAPDAALPQDLGIFPELDPHLARALPSWLTALPHDVWRSAQGGLGWYLVQGVPVAPAPNTEATTLRGAPLGASDADGDGIPDALDVLLGAKKVAANGAEYHARYVPLDYPGGDVPRTEGVCTDVVIRALRNAGYDLQALVHEDAVAHPERYPNIAHPDANIDHRRVRNLLPWFVSHWVALPPQSTDAAPYLPGDLVFFDTLSTPGPDHLGLLSDEVGPSGVPLVVNNWTYGYRESEMDLLASVPITHRFRVPTAVLPTAGAASTPTVATHRRPEP